MVSLTTALAAMLMAGVGGSATAASPEGAPAGPSADVTAVDSTCEQVNTGVVRNDDRTQSWVTEEQCWNALGYWAHDVSLFGGKQVDSGPTPTVELESDASNSPQIVTAPTGRIGYGPAMLFTSDEIEVKAVGRTGTGGFLRSQSKITNINKAETQPNRTGSEVRTADKVQGQCRADGSGTTAKTIVENGTVRTHAQAEDHGEAVVSIPKNPPVNYMVEGHVHLGFWTDHFVIVFNEQIENPDGSITLNPVHEYYGYVINDQGELEETPPFAQGGSILHGHLYLGQVHCGVSTE